VTDAESNHAALIESLTYANWFDLLPVIVDTYADQDRWDEAEAVKYVMGYASSKQAQKQVSVKFRNAVNKNDYEEKIGVLLQAFIDVYLSGIKPDDDSSN
jgi:hypothetical protein